MPFPVINVLKFITYASKMINKHTLEALGNSSVDKCLPVPCIHEYLSPVLRAHEKMPCNVSKFGFMLPKDNVGSLFG